MELESLRDLIKSRRSIRMWQDKEVPEELLIQAVELATWAPNGGNQQNWHFYIIKNQAVIEAFADMVQTTADTVASWPEADNFRDFAARQQERSSFFRNAPAAIAVSAAQYDSPLEQILGTREKTDPQANQWNQWRRVSNTRIQSVASAIAYLLLILHQMGLGTVWMTGPMHTKGELEKMLKVPENTDIVALIPVGYPAETPDYKGRKAISEVCDVIR
ncbi:nitroreductase family protein [Chloroflexota bacterium]